MPTPPSFWIITSDRAQDDRRHSYARTKPRSASEQCDGAWHHFQPGLFVTVGKKPVTPQVPRPYAQTSNTVRHMKNLRRKLESDPVEPRYVLTVYGVGYKLTDEL